MNIELQLFDENFDTGLTIEGESILANCWVRTGSGRDCLSVRPICIASFVL